jgi:cytochrome c oxidase subunit II
MKLKSTMLSIGAAMLVAALLTIQPVPAENAPRRIEIAAKRFNFTPAEITLKKGEPVVLTLTTADVPHGLRFKELGIETKAAKGKPGVISFTPDKTGTFIGHCSVFCGSGHGGMALTLHVVD